MMTPADIDDTLLTAFALGELDTDSAERVRVAAYVQGDGEAQRFVEEVRESAGLVIGALGMELVDGLTEFQHELVERRLRELHEGSSTLRFHSAELQGSSGFGGSGSRFRQWLPTLASVAASVVIVAGTLAFLLPRFHNAPLASNAGGAKPANPADRSAASDPSARDAIADAGKPVEGLEAMNVAKAGGNDDDDNADASSQGTAEPKWVPVQKVAPKKTPKAPTAVASSVAKKPSTAADAQTAVAVRPRTMRTAEAVEAKRNVVVSAAAPAAGQKPVPAAHLPKTVNASPPRDPEAFDKIAKTSPTTAKEIKQFENPFRTATQGPRSSFQVWVGDWSYGKVREALLDGRFPAPQQVRVEELVNHFKYVYPAPTDDATFCATIEVATCPWEFSHRLARVMLKARDRRDDEPSDKSQPVARDVTASLHFNAGAATAWRLLGYETGQAAPSGGFPAADLTPGAAVTALYEIIPVAAPNATAAAGVDPFALTVSYRTAAGAPRKTVKFTAHDAGEGLDHASEDFHFASAVAAFGMLLRDCKYAGTANYADVIRWATAGKGEDETKQRAEFIDLARHARDLSR